MNLWFTLCLHFAGYDEGIHTIAEQKIVHRALNKTLVIAFMCSHVCEQLT